MLRHSCLTLVFNHVYSPSVIQGCAQINVMILIATPLSHLAAFGECRRAASALSNCVSGMGGSVQWLHLSLLSLSTLARINKVVGRLTI